MSMHTHAAEWIEGPEPARLLTIGPAANAEPGHDPGNLKTIVEPARQLLDYAVGHGLVDSPAIIDPIVKIESEIEPKSSPTRLPWPDSSNPTMRCAGPRRASPPNRSARRRSATSGGLGAAVRSVRERRTAPARGDPRPVAPAARLGDEGKLSQETSAARCGRIPLRMTVLTVTY